MTKQHLIYRNSSGVGPQAHLQAALGDFYRCHRRLPGEIVVHPTLMNEAMTAMAALEVPNLPVVTTGGCLATEVWLGVPSQEATNG